MKNKLLRTFSLFIPNSIINQKRFYKIEDTFDNDIFVAGYPKSGNTWMQNLLAGLVFAINGKFLPDRLTQELVPDVHYKLFYKRYLDFSIFKTHHLPQKKYKKVIHLVRDPRDVMVSYYHFNQGLGYHDSLEEMIINNKNIICSWEQHTKKWIENEYKAEILVVKYEDLKNDTSKELLKICEFVGISRSTDLVRQVVDTNTITEMKRKENMFGFDNIVHSTTWNKKKMFNREGKVGTFSNLLSPDLKRIIEEKANAEMKHFDYL